MNLYEVLGANPRATPGELREAYLTRIRLTHPDRVSDRDKEAAGRMAADVNAAWAVLGDPVRRVEYDRSLEQPSGPSPSIPTPPAAPPAAHQATTAPAPITLRQVLNSTMAQALEKARSQAPDPPPPGDLETLVHRATEHAANCSQLMEFCLNYDEAATALAAEGLGRAAAATAQTLSGDKAVRGPLLKVLATAAAAQESLAHDLRPGLRQHLTPWRHHGIGYPQGWMAYVRAKARS